MKVKELWKRLIISHKVPKLPQGYVYQNRIFGFEIAGNHVGQICWIRGGKTLSGKELPGFWKELDSSDVIDMNGKSRKMTYVPMSKFSMVNGTIDEGDVFIVLHNSGRVIRVCERDIEEKSKRRALKQRGVATV